MTKPKPKKSTHTKTGPSRKLPWQKAMRENLLFNLASDVIDGEVEVHGVWPDFEKASITLNTEIDTLSNLQRAFLRAKKHESIMLTERDAVTLIHRDESLTRLMVAIAHYLEAKTDVEAECAIPPQLERGFKLVLDRIKAPMAHSTTSNTR